jgi:hypothetical protein
MKLSFKLGLVTLVAMVTLSACSSKVNDVNTANTDQQAKEVTSQVVTPWIASKNTTRVNTDNPQEAAVIVSQSLWMANSEDNRPGSIILTDPENWQNALVSADLIHHPSNGPILFVNKDGIPEVTANEMERLQPTGVESNNGVQVILVGDLGQQVKDQAEELGFKLDIVTGGNPADLAQAIDDYYAKVAGEIPLSVIIGSMESPEYTLPAINWIAHMPETLLYVKKDEIPQETVEALQTRGGKANIYILGPKSVVSVKVEKGLQQYGKTVRISGNNPYENAIAFAKYKDLETGFGWGITKPGHNFSFVNAKSTALAIAAAPFSHLGKHSPLLWSDEDGMPESVMSYMVSVQPKYDMSPTEGPYNHAWLTGSHQSLTSMAQGEIDTMLEIVSKSGPDHGSMPGMKH